jgi:hypothetical protein
VLQQRLGLTNIDTTLACSRAYNNTVAADSYRAMSQIEGTSDQPIARIDLRALLGVLNRARLTEPGRKPYELNGAPSRPSISSSRFLLRFLVILTPGPSLVTYHLVTEAIPLNGWGENSTTPFADPIHLRLKLSIAIRFPM